VIAQLIPQHGLGQVRELARAVVHNDME
jgi:hypothetical protein